MRGSAEDIKAAVWVERRVERAVCLCPYAIQTHVRAEALASATEATAVKRSILATIVTARVEGEG